MLSGLGKSLLLLLESLNIGQVCTTRLACTASAPSTTWGTEQTLLAVHDPPGLGTNYLNYARIN